MVRFASAVLAGLLGLVAAASAQVTVLSPAQQCVASANAGGTANALTIPLLPCGASTNILLLNVTKTNTGAAPTLQMLGFAAHPIVASNGNTVPAGALVAGDTVMLNSQGQNWRLLTRADVLTNELTNDYVWIGNLSNQAEPQVVSGDITLSQTGLATLAPMPAHTFKGNPENVTAVPVNMNATTSTAELNAMIGDSGAGGTKGLAPAPAAGDATAGKFLKADGTWQVPSSGTVYIGPTIAYTGVWNPIPVLIGLSPISVTLETEVFDSTGGATIDTLTPNVGAVAGSQAPSAVSFSNLTGYKGLFGEWTGIFGSLTSLAGPELKIVTGTFDPNVDFMPMLASMSFPVLVAVGENFEPYGENSVTTFDFPALKRVGGSFDPGTTTVVTSFNFPALVSIGGSFFPGSLPSLTSADFGLLEKVYGDFRPTGWDSITELDFPALATVGSDFTIDSFPLVTGMDFSALATVGHDFTVQNMTPAMVSFPALTRVSRNIEVNHLTNATGLDFPVLQQADGLDFDQIQHVASLSFPAMQSCAAVNGGTGVLNLTNMASLATVSLSAIVDMCQVTISPSATNVPNLTSFAVNLSTVKSAGSIKIQNTSLPEAAVDHLLHLLFVLDGTGGTTEWQHAFQVDGTNTASPSATGLSEATVVCARGSVTIKVKSLLVC